MATIFAFLLPATKKSAYFHPNSSCSGCPDNRDNNFENLSSQKIITADNNNVKKSFLKKIQIAYFLLWKDFLKAYTNLHVFKWSLWWAAASCGYLQVVSYSQPVWQTAVHDKQIIYNGAVEAIYSIIGSFFLN